MSEKTWFVIEGEDRVTMIEMIRYKYALWHFLTDLNLLD